MAIINDNPDISQEDEKNEAVLLKMVDDFYKEVRDHRVRTVEHRWFLNHIHYRALPAKWNKLTKKLVIVNDDYYNRFYVNLIKPYVRAASAHITKYRPQWDVDARPYGTVNSEAKALLGDYLDYQYDRLSMRKKARTAAKYGFLYNQGIFMYGWDSDEDEGLGNVWVEVIDPWDVYFDRLATDMKSCRRVLRVIRKNIEEVKNNPRYNDNRLKLNEDNKQSSSDYKEHLDSMSYGVGSSNDKKESTVLLYELWSRDIVDGKKVIRVITKANNNIIRNEVTGYKNLPFILYTPEEMPGDIYGDAPIQDAIPVNKKLNDLERSMGEYHQIMAKGRFIMDKNANVKVITNENGAIIKKVPGTDVREMPMGNYSSSGVRQIENMQKYLQDITGITDTFRGQIPTQLSGVAIEQLYAASGEQLLEASENMEIALAELGTEILKLSAMYFDEARAVKTTQAKGQSTVFKVMGEEALTDKATGIKKPAPEDVTIIPYGSEVTVKISSGLGFTKEAKQERASMLFDKGAIGTTTLLEEMGMDAEREQQRLEEEKMRIAESELQIQSMMQPMPPMGGEMPPMDPAAMPMEGMPPQEMAPPVPPMA